MNEGQPAACAPKTEAPAIDPAERIAVVLKAVCDPLRLRMLGQLAVGPQTEPVLAQAMGLPQGALSRHVQILRDAGLVGDGAAPPENPVAAAELRLELKVMQEAMRGAIAKAKESSPAGSRDDAHGILRRFFDGPKLRNLPAQRSMKDAVFEEILRRLPVRSEYPERELNGLIEAIYPDFCTIRRELVDSLYMERSAGVYKLSEKGRKVVESAPPA